MLLRGEIIRNVFFADKNDFRQHRGIVVIIHEETSWRYGYIVPQVRINKWALSLSRFEGVQLSKAAQRPELGTTYSWGYRPLTLT